MLMATAGVSAAGELASGPGTLWSWGLNDKGQIGNGNKLNVSSPVQIGSATNWTKVVRTGRHSLSLNSSGKIYSWGYNALGGLGHNNTTYLSSPVQVGSLTTWSKITGSERSSMAIKTDGTLWTWGGGSYGQTGHGDAVHRSSPVQVGSLTNWSTVTCGHAGTVLAVKTDGTLWGWGNNASGSVGNGTILHVSSPTQIGSDTLWTDELSSAYGALAIKVVA
jgi:alpha-tubulin suppressor-like RCC1 family protein